MVDAKRKKNSPSMKELISEYLKKRKNSTAELREITDYVLARVTLTSKKPRNSVYSVLYRMDDVQRIDDRTYKLIVK